MESSLSVVAPMPSAYIEAKKKLDQERALKYITPRMIQDRTNSLVDTIQHHPALDSSQKNQLISSVHSNPSLVGKLILTGLAAVAAPMVMKYISDSPTINALSIPLGGAAGYSLYELFAEKRPEFSYSLPVKDNQLGIPN